MDEERSKTNINLDLAKQRQFDELNPKTHFIQHAIEDFLEAIEISSMAKEEEWSKARICLAKARLADGLRGNIEYISAALWDYKCAEMNYKLDEER